MSYKIFINNCEYGDHWGLLEDRDCLKDEGRPPIHKIDVIKSRIESSISVTLNDGIQFTWPEIDKAIDDFFLQLKDPLLDGIPKKIPVSNGEVEILSKDTFGKNADEIKKELRDIYEFLKKYGKKVIVK